MFLRGLYRYPVKGFSPDALSEVALSAGQVLPYDRRWSLAFGGQESAIDTADAKSWAGLRKLLSLAREPKGAKLQTEFNEGDCRLILRQKGKIVCEGSLNDENDRRSIEAFLNDFYSGTAFGDFRILQATHADKATSGGGFTDFDDSHISLINLNTVGDIARAAEVEVEPLRFRGNLYFEGDAWAERNWQGKKLRIGEVQLTCTEEIERCRATSVSLETGDEDMNMPLILRRRFGHMLCGIYAQVTEGGVIKTGDRIELL